MNSDLDHWLATLRDRPDDRRLDQLETSTWLRIGALRRRQTQAGRWGWRAAMAAAMAALGAFFAGYEQAQETSPFAVRAELAPSTLLEDAS